MRILVLIAAALMSASVASPARAAVKLLDSFTSAIAPDGVFTGASRGFLGWSGGSQIVPVLGSAEITANQFRTPTFAGLQYDFPATPDHPVVLSRVTINARNAQTNAAETGILRVRAVTGAGTLDREVTLAGGATAQDYDFDFSALGAALSLQRLEVTWDLPSGGTGARVLLMNQIDLYEVPEPATIALIGLASSCGGFVGYRRRKAAAKKS